MCYADLALYHLVEGLPIEYPDGWEACRQKFPRLVQLHKAVSERPAVAARLSKRPDFTKTGLCC